MTNPCNYRNYRELSDDELQELERLYPATPNRELSRRFNISPDALIRRIAYPRGWKKDRKVIFIGSRNGRSLTEREEKWIILHYKHTKNEDIMRKFDIGEGTLHRMARKHGLKKSPQQRRKMQQQASQAARTICRDYGLYDELSVRMKKKIADMKARGERMPGSFRPGESNKDRLSPQRFRETMAKIHASRNESIRKDRIRIHFGLPQKTRMRLSYGGDTHQLRLRSQHRHIFRRHNYIVDRGSNIIYYDDLTDRHPLMEANAPKYGLTVKEAERGVVNEE